MSLRPTDNNSLNETDGGVQNTSLVDEKEGLPLNNPDAAANEAMKNLKIGGEEWNFKVCTGWPINC